ncbi:hypothetical protein, partial [Streptomyces anthocyanicus]|uniref:hypothetical protein n=1 Tax=Streptomyces anthocyanicus TaxID=68174 RepID=UPI00365A91DD
MGVNAELLLDEAGRRGLARLRGCSLRGARTQASTPPQALRKPSGQKRLAKIIFSSQVHAPGMSLT